VDFLLYSAYCFNKCLTNVIELLIWESSYRILNFWPIPCSSWKENVCQCQRFTRSKKHNKVVKISTSTANSVLSIGFPRENPSCELTRHSGLTRGRCRVSSQDIAPSDSRFLMGLTVVVSETKTPKIGRTGVLVYETKTPKTGRNGCRFREIP